MFSGQVLARGEVARRESRTGLPLSTFHLTSRLETEPLSEYSSRSFATPGVQPLISERDSRLCEQEEKNWQEHETARERGQGNYAGRMTREEGEGEESSPESPMRGKREGKKGGVSVFSLSSRRS